MHSLKILFPAKEKKKRRNNNSAIDESNESTDSFSSAKGPSIWHNWSEKRQ